jgi:hypothetical protein
MKTANKDVGTRDLSFSPYLSLHLPFPLSLFLSPLFGERIRDKKVIWFSSSSSVEEYAATGDVPLIDALLSSGHYHERYSVEKHNTLEARMWSYLVANMEQIECASAEVREKKISRETEKET